MGRPSWAVRRRIIISVLLWAGALITYLAIWGRAVTLVSDIATGLILLMGSVIGSYVFGAVWDDKNTRKAEVAQSAVDQTDTPETQVRIEQ